VIRYSQNRYSIMMLNGDSCVRGQVMCQYDTGKTRGNKGKWSKGVRGARESRVYHGNYRASLLIRHGDRQ